MTKEEYNSKCENGTLTVSDVLSNLKFSTLEQIDEIRKYAPDKIAGLLDIYRKGREMAGGILNLRANLDNAVIMDNWEQLSGQSTDGENTEAAIRESVEKTAAFIDQMTEIYNTDGIGDYASEGAKKCIEELTRLKAEGEKVLQMLDEESNNV